MQLYLVLELDYPGPEADILTGLNSSARSLYLNPAGRSEETAGKKPFLFEWPHSDAFVSHVDAEGVSQGILLAASEAPDIVFRHLRRFLKVRVEGREKAVFFRFYDPAILSIFLPSCSPQQLQEFFGPIAAFFVADEDPVMLKAFSFRSGKLLVSAVTMEEMLDGVSQAGPAHLDGFEQAGASANSDSIMGPVKRGTAPAAGAKANWKPFE